MKGQWIGNYTGTNAGTIMVNVDEFPSHFQGVAYINDSNPLLPGIAVTFRTKDKENRFEIQTNQIYPIDPKTGTTSTWDNVKHFYGQLVVIPTAANATVSWGDDFLTLSWTTNIGTKAQCTLSRSKADKPSAIIASDKDWDTYKTHVATLDGRRYLFRGQNDQRRLRTAFHRTGRADLVRFLLEDIQALHRHLSARTKHVFNLQIPDENGAFLSLAQHHGYPTPLLDWTYSPYVAAFFAYRGISNKKASEAVAGTKVRIYVFDQLQWKTDWSQLVMLLTTSPHVSVSEFMAIENERLIPQQAVSMVTNLDDIETYIKTKETNGKQYLWAIDLPIGERTKVIHQLSYMGITAGSLFPGLEGACQELKERNFDI